MKVTNIKQQSRRSDRYSIYVDNNYAFSLSDEVLLESKLTNGQELNEEQLEGLKVLADTNKLYSQALRYAALRMRTQWEVDYYLERKQVSPALRHEILNKLSKLQILDDEKYARTYINDRRLLRPTSRRKMKLDLRKKHVPDEFIEQAIGSESRDETLALKSVIDKKRRQPKYQDNVKLMQYLARQGFQYGDIKAVLEAEKH